MTIQIMTELHATCSQELKTQQVYVFFKLRSGNLYFCQQMLQIRRNKMLDIRKFINSQMAIFQRKSQKIRYLS